MNRKPLLILVVVGLVLGGISVYLTRRNAASFQRADKSASEKLLGDFPINEVSRITLRRDTNEVNLVRDGVWKVQERDRYPAHAEEVVRLARRLWDLRPAQSQKIGPSQLGRLELLAPAAGATNSGTLVELKDKEGKIIRALLLGKASTRSADGAMGGGEMPNGRWLYLPDKPGTAYLVSETFSEIEPSPGHWLSKDFLRVTRTRSVEVGFPEATNSWKLTRETETGEWKLADARPGEQLDGSKAASASNPLNSATFSDVMAGSKLGDGPKPKVIRIETFDDFVYLIQVGQKTNEEYPLTVSVTAQIQKERTAGADEKAEDKAKLDKEFSDSVRKLEEKLQQERRLENWTYLVSGWTVESLLKERSQLLAEKQEAPKENGTELPGMGIPPLPAAGANGP